MHSKEFIELIPLGGLGEFGMNMMVLRYGGHTIIIDSGLMFPDERLPGVEVIVPDISFLEELASEIEAFVLTHGHEDHIGGLPFIFPKLNQVPIYGTQYTLALVSAKLAEHNLLDEAQLVEVQAGQVVQIKDFKIEFIHVTHSIVGAVMLAISTPPGVIIHSGDFKIDLSPLDNLVTDLPKISEYGRKGVLALLSDSTNAERSGHTLSEKTVIQKLEQLFKDASGKVVISCFSSSIHRIQTVFDLAFNHGRKVAVGGRRMIATIKMAYDLGYLDIPDGLLISPEDVKRLSPDQVVLIVTGSQGEPRAVLPQMSFSNYKKMTIEQGDTVIISARIIPGNEKPVSRMINDLYRRGAVVHYEDGSLPPVHVSGHASAEELKLLLNLIRPKFFIPIHGEYSQLYCHAEIAKNLGVVEEKVLVAKSGDCIQLSQENIQITGEVQSGRILIDSGSRNKVEESLVKDRQYISQDGIVLVIVTINGKTKKMHTQPQIVMRGFISANGDESLTRDCQSRVIEMLADCEEETDWTLIEKKISKDLKRFLFKQTSKRPLILPVIMEI